MDEFLVEGKSYERLLREYKEHGSLQVGYDFDGTVHDYHKSGASYEMVRQLLRDLKDIGCVMTCWTAFKDHTYVFAFCEEHNIPCDGINTNGIPLPWESRKPFFSVLLDDRAGMIQVFQDLTRLVKEVRKKKFYRVCNTESEQGLWYAFDGKFTGLIHEKFNFCKHKDLPMDFDEKLKGWLSVTDDLNNLYEWFPEEDIKKLQEHGYCIHEYESSEYWFYDKFSHFVINQHSSVVVNKIML